MSFVKISWSAATNCGTRRAEDKAQTGSYSLRKLGSESDASDEVDPWGDRSMVCLFGWVGSPRLIFQKKTWSSGWSMIPWKLMKSWGNLIWQTQKIKHKFDALNFWCCFKFWVASGPSHGEPSYTRWLQKEYTFLSKDPEPTENLSYQDYHNT